MIKLLAFCFLFILASTDTFKAKVIVVTYGDTIVVLADNNQQIKIRLEGIDCPESNQDFGERAKQATVKLCFGKEVLVQKTGEDQYGRTLAYIYVGDLCVNKQLLSLGMAWHFKKYNKDQELARLEIEAREKKIGLWSQPNPIAPWDFRHNKQ
jgi:endonuclease YncB( thermonuclease family)